MHASFFRKVYSNYLDLNVLRSFKCVNIDNQPFLIVKFMCRNPLCSLKYKINNYGHPIYPRGKSLKISLRFCPNLKTIAKKIFEKAPKAVF